MQVNYDKIIRKFTDTEGNIYTIKEKTNKHKYLTIQKKNETFATIFEGSKNDIFMKLQDIHKNTKFIEVDKLVG